MADADSERPAKRARRGWASAAGENAEPAVGCEHDAPQVATACSDHSSSSDTRSGGARASGQLEMVSGGEDATSLPEGHEVPGHDRGAEAAPAEEDAGSDAFEQFLEERKAKARGGAGASAGGNKRPRAGAAGAEQLRPKVHAFVGELLEPLLARGCIDVRQFTEVLGRAVEKVLSVHGDAEDAGFLESEAKRICRLVDKYVAFVKAHGGAI